MTTSSPPTAPAAPIAPLLAARLQADAALVAAGRLHPDCAAHFYPASGAPRAVVLLLHGFTAGPWQYRALAAQLTARSMHAIAARLPGHGATAAPSAAEGGGPAAFTHALMPRAYEARAFADSATEAWAAARAQARLCGVPLRIVGFSAGGAMAADLLLRAQTDIERAVLVAPLLRPANAVRRLFFAAMARLWGGSALIDRIGYAWSEEARTDGWQRPGHSTFRLGHVGALFAYVRSLPLGSGLPVPTQFVLTAADTKIDLGACLRLARMAPDRHGACVFPAAQNVPHAMLSPEENPVAEAHARALGWIGQFLEDGVPIWAP